MKNVIYWVLENFISPIDIKVPEFLDYLSKDKDWYVRCLVAQNPNTTSETLDELSRDEYVGVRYFVARNPNTSPETLKQMAIDEDDDDDVKYHIKINPNCSEETISFNQIIPSKNMDEEEYHWFLNLATILELESDIVTQETYYKICKKLSRPIPRPVLSYVRVL